MEYRRDFFHLHAVGATKFIFKNKSSRGRKRQGKRKFFSEATERMACALNYLSLDYPYYVQEFRDQSMN